MRAVMRQSIALPRLQVLQPGEVFVATAESSGHEEAACDVAKVAAGLFRMVSAARAEAAVGGDTLLQLWGLLARVTVDLLARGGASVDFATDWQGVSTGALEHRHADLLAIPTGHLRSCGRGS